MNVYVDQYQTLHVPRLLEITGLVTAFETTYDEHFYYEGESHNFWEMVCILEGKVGATADNRVYELEENQVLFHKPMEFHRLWSAHGTKPHLLIISFEAKKILRLRDHVFRLEAKEMAQMVGLLKDADEIFCRNEIMLTQIKKGQEGNAQLFINRLERVLLQVFGRDAAFDTYNQSQSALNYMRIIETMQDNLSANLSVEELAQKCSMSKSNLKKTFEKYAGEGVIKHFNDLKIREAILMLQKGYSVNEVSRSLGFREPSYFSTVFKRCTGYSPTKYLKMLEADQ